MITREYLRSHPNHIFVFGDNLDRKGYGGAAALRDEPNTYGFITKKHPNNNIESFYKPDEYEPIFNRELEKLIKTIVKNPDKIFLITRLGAGLANKWHIFEKIIEPKIRILANMRNVVLLK